MVSDAKKATDRETIAARTLFFEKPDLSLEDALHVLQQRFPGTFSRDALAKVRHEVRATIDDGYDGRKSAGQFLANPPRVVRKSSSVVDFSELGAEATASKETPMKSRDIKEQTPEDRDVRKRWFSEWAESNYMSTVAEARQALLERFGVAFGTDYLSKTLRIAKDRQKAKQREASEPRFSMPPETNPRVPVIRPADSPLGIAAYREPQTLPMTVDFKNAPPTEAEELARRMRRIGLRKIELFEDGTFTFEPLIPRYRLD